MGPFIYEFPASQTLMYPHEIMNKTDQKQQLNKIYINTKVKACHCEEIK